MVEWPWPEKLRVPNLFYKALNAAQNSVRPSAVRWINRRAIDLLENCRSSLNNNTTRLPPSTHGCHAFCLEYKDALCAEKFGRELNCSDNHKPNAALILQSKDKVNSVRIGVSPRTTFMALSWMYKPIGLGWLLLIHQLGPPIAASIWRACNLPTKACGRRALLGTARSIWAMPKQHQLYLTRGVAYVAAAIFSSRKSLWFIEENNTLWRRLRGVYIVYAAYLRGYD